MLGLRHNGNLLVDYDPEWATEFSRESKRIANALGGSAKGIEHYGSTAVIGMRAKPIIDILVGVAPFEDWEACKAPLERLGYDCAVHAGVPGHHKSVKTPRSARTSSTRGILQRGMAL